jgi:general secretion pathway protein F
VVPSFEYSALTADGRRVAGVLAGPGEQAVLAELESRQLTPVSVREKASSSSSRGGRGFSLRRMGEAYGQIADLLASGVPLLRGLRLLGGRKSQPRLATVFRELAEAVEKGSELGAAMEARPEVFPTVHVAMVRAGEKGGFLDEVLAKLGQLVLKQAEMRSKIVGALVYPAILIGLGVVIGAVIFGVFVPKFRPMFDRIQTGLPLMTRVVFFLSDLIGKYGLVTLAGVIVGGLGVRQLIKVESAGAWWERAKTRLPVVGPLIRMMATARLCRLLGTMLGNGVPMISALQIAREGTGNALMARAVDRATEAVRAGEPLATPLSESGLVDDDVIEMIRVGEAANNLGEVLVKVADTIEVRLDRLIGTATKLIEPAILVVLALIVGLVAAALLIPMTQLRGAV